MTERTSKLRVMATSLMVAAGCGGEPGTAVSGDAQARTSQARSGMLTASAQIDQELADLRRVVAPFHRFDAAVAAGWSTQITPCLSNPTQGAMGYHYGNTALIDGAVTVEQPELLLYEPMKNGQLRFVAVEYIIPFAIRPATATPPVLFGQEFHQNFEAGLWALHVWVGRHNPAGLFADWNPNVSCEYATQ